LRNRSLCLCLGLGDIEVEKMQVVDAGVMLSVKPTAASVHQMFVLLDLTLSARPPTRYCERGHSLARHPILNDALRPIQLLR
jgi:hypothetical protein